MVIQPIVDIPAICAAHGIRQAVICPGSRSALITIAFARHPDIETFVIPDERAACFVALGLAQSSRQLVAIICTSGTAAANLYPAIIEAFYQEVPLLVITADRPPELIGQHDGQTINQHNIYANHIRGYYQFPSSFSTKHEADHATRLVNEAILTATDNVKGPVHLNVPVREPFYPLKDEKLYFSHELKIIRRSDPQFTISPDEIHSMLGEFVASKKIMILAGQHRPDVALAEMLRLIRAKCHCVIVGELFSNLGNEAITNHDVVLAGETAALRPDLLISFGHSVLSKNLKNFIRRNPLKAHWHVGINPTVIDTYQSLTRKIVIKPEVFFRLMGEQLPVLGDERKEYLNAWLSRSKAAAGFLDAFLMKNDEGEFGAVAQVMKHIPTGSSLHLANSMPVRYATYAGLEQNRDIAVWANRGTSGIDGCTSTAVGHAINAQNLHVLLTGDMAFFYDRNALWHKHLPANLRIVVLNNHGGGIFRLIDGPGQLPELEDYFETHQPLTAENTARDFHMAYFSARGGEDLRRPLADFFASNTGAAILEIESDAKSNEAIFRKFRQGIMQLWKP